MATSPDKPDATALPREQATLAGGCFWCLEGVFELVRGVDRVVSGYAGGHVAEPAMSKSAPAPPAMPRPCKSPSTRPR